MKENIVRFTLRFKFTMFYRSHLSGEVLRVQLRAYHRNLASLLCSAEAPVWRGVKSSPFSTHVEKFVEIL